MPLHLKQTWFCGGITEWDQEHSSSLLPQMQIESLPCKKETVYKPHPETTLPLLHQSSFKLDWGEVGKYPVAWRVNKIDILFGSYGLCVLHTKEERDHQAFYQSTVQKPACVMVWGWISAHGIIGDLHTLCPCEDTINAEYYKVWDPHMLASIWGLFQSRPCSFQHLQVLQQHGSLVGVQEINRPACSPDLSPIEHFWCIMKHNICQKNEETLNFLAKILH